MTEGLGKLLVDHLALAKLELTQALKATGADVGMIAGAVPLLIIGYCFICSGVAVVLVRWLGVAGGLFATGGFHVLLGLVLALIGALRLRNRRWMEATVEELNQTTATLMPVANGAERKLASGE